MKPILLALCLSVFVVFAYAADQAPLVNYADMPLSFEINHGQTDPAIKFLARGNGYTLFLTSTEAVFAFPTGARTNSHTPPIRMQLLGALPSPQVMGIDELPGKTNYFVGSNAGNWHANIPTYAKVQYSNIYPKIDLLYYAKESELEFDIIAAPGADLRAIQLKFQGSNQIRVDVNGDLLLDSPDGGVRLHAPTLYQPGDDRISPNHNLQARYILQHDNIVGLQVTGYDPERTLVIDPVLRFSTLLGGSSETFGNAIAVDRFGFIYVTGATTSVDLPSTAGAFQRTYQGDTGWGYQSVVGDIFVTKFDPTGRRLIYSTYLGGSAGDTANAIAIDEAGYVYLTGGTSSFDFPVTPGAYQPSSGGLNDVFITKLNPSGSGLVFSTHIGVAGEGIRGFGIAVDRSGYVYVAGGAGPGFPTTPGAYKTYCFGTNGFVVKLNPIGTAAVYSTFLGGSYADWNGSIAVDNQGNAYLTGTSYSYDFPTLETAYQTGHTWGADTFVSVLNADGSDLLYSTLLGGSDNDEGFNIGLDASGKVYVSGVTRSSDFPVTSGVVQPVFGGGINDAFVAKLDTSKSGTASLLYSTFLGGSGHENLQIFPYGTMAVDPSGNVYLTGGTTSTDFPRAHPIQAVSGGGWDVYVAKLNPTGSRLIYSTYLGSSGDEFGSGIAVDRRGAVYITGETWSADFPTTPRAFQRVFRGTRDAFVVKIAPTSSW